MTIFQALRRYRLISVKLAKFHFNPGLISTIVTMVMLYLMISLGLWQLDRADYKQALESALEQRKSLSAKNLELLPQSKDERRFMPVRLNGHYVSDKSLLLDNKIFHGQVGYHVYTPFMMDTGKQILVNRGFVPQGKSRQDLPDTSISADPLIISGILDLPPSRTVTLSAYQHQFGNWPVVVQHIDLAEISQVLQSGIYDMVLWLDENQVGSKQYDLPVLNLNSAKHTGYAFQWFAMSLALIIIYLVVNTRHVK
jgi:surfeit locus 1 family protein